MGLDIAELTGQRVRLERLAEPHREGLRSAADDARIWVHTLMVARGAGFDKWFDDTLKEHDTGVKVPFAVRQLSDGQLVGSTSYIDINLKHKRLEIGATWYHPSVWASAVNPECKLLLLAHAFDVLGVNRVSLLTDLRNERSQAAIAKLGAVREGVMRSHVITQGDRIRDSVLYSIIASEWPQARERLRARLEEPSSK